MSPLARFTDACVTSAARRWPAEIADTMSREWRAELAYLRRAGQVWRQLAYAMSLALSPSVRSENPVTLRDRLPRMGPATLTVLLYAGVALAAETLDRAADTPANIPIMGFGGNNLIMAYAIGLTAMACLGVLAGRRVPVAEGRHPLLAAAAVTLPMAAVVYFLARNDLQDRAANEYAWSTPLAVAAWVAVTTVVLALTRRWIARGRRALAWLVGAIGALVAVDLAATIEPWPSAAKLGLSPALSPLWFPLSLNPPAAPALGAPVEWHGTFGVRITSTANGVDFQIEYLKFTPAQIVLQAAHLVLPLFLCGVFAVVATARAAARATARAADGVVADEATVARSDEAGAGLPGPAASAETGAIGRLVRPVGAALAAGGTVVWATIAATYRTDFSHWLGEGDDLPMRAWFTATGLIACGIALMLAGRRPVAVPAFAAWLAMIGAQAGFTHTHHGASLGATLAAGTAIVAVGLARGLSDLMRRVIPGERRRVLVFVAVAAAVALPGGMRSGGMTLRLALLDYAMVVLLAVGAAVAALAARPTPTRPLASVAVVLGTVAAAVVSGSAPVARALYWFDYHLVIQLPLSLLLLYVAVPRPGRRAGWARAVAVLAALALSPLLGRDLTELGDAASIPLIPLSAPYMRIYLDSLPVLAAALAAVLCRSVPPEHPVPAKPVLAVFPA